MVKHIVTFKLTGTAEERRAVAEKFADALRALPARIDVLESMEVGINENPAESWDLVLTATVPTLADVETYSNHPPLSRPPRSSPATRPTGHASTTRLGND